MNTAALLCFAEGFRGHVGPEEEAVTQAEESFLSPLGGTTAFLVALKQQALKLSAHHVAQVEEVETLKVPGINRCWELQPHLTLKKRRSPPLLYEQQV